jgi:hypothetical protein
MIGMYTAMPKIILSLWGLAIPFSGFSQNLSQYQWENRLVLLFAPSPSYTDYQIQMDSFQQEKSGMSDRKLVVLSVFSDSMTSTDNKAWTDTDVRNLRINYLPGDQESASLLIGLDGGVKWRTDIPASTAELFSRIDAMPMRRRELKKSDDGRGN